ncbi:MAG: methyltransferase MtaB domain-containing protein [Anaerolineae bacterium]
MGNQSSIQEFPDRLAYSAVEDMIFGRALHPVTCGHDIVIGGGQVLPEVKFTLPTMQITEDAVPKIREIYREAASQILDKAVQLAQPSLVIEFEQLYEMTQDPSLGARLTQDLREVMDTYHERYGVRSALRVTVADIREQVRPPLMREGTQLESMLNAFDRCAAAGADILAIESTGGKEVSDQALLEANLEGLAYALGVLAPKDMAFLWDHITAIANRHGIVSGGDTACGFGNTAMQLAHQGMIPKVLAAMVRLMTGPRSLMAVLHGATGPLKDCGYENPMIKAITGVPISMEGKSSACAHSSPLGNIAAATCDLWSNESVQYVRLLGGYAPEVFAEILIYDCRLMNTATAKSAAPVLRDLLVESDRYLDPQALVLDPEVMYEAAQHIVDAGPSPYAQTVEMARFAATTINQALDAGKLELDKREQRWLKRLTIAVERLPDDPEELRARIDPAYAELYLPEAYGL